MDRKKTFVGLHAHPGRGRFALGCVESLRGLHAAPLVALRQAVERRISGTATLHESEVLQRESHAWVSAGGIEGLPRCLPSAAAALAAWHTAAADPYEAAFWMADYRRDGKG